MAKKEVRFDLYCKTCEYEDNKEFEPPCDQCLDNFFNEDSHRPVQWREKETTGNTKKPKRRWKKIFKRGS